MSPPRRTTPAPTPRKRGRPEGSGVAALTRERILRAGVDCFAQSGYARTSNRDIAGRAGITAGSLYHYFPSKAALFEEALHHCTATLVQAYRSACAEAPEQSTVEQLCLGLERVGAIARDWPGIIRFAGNSAAEIRRNAELHWLEDETARAFPEFFAGLCARARARGELSADVDPADAAHLLLALISGLSGSQGPGDGEPDRFEAHVQAFRRLLRGTLFASPPGTGKRRAPDN